MSSRVAPKTTISRELGKFKKTKNPKFLVTAAVLLVRSGRLNEMAYGAYCFAVHPAPKVVPQPGITFETYHAELQETLSKLRAKKRDAISQVEPGIVPGDEPLYCMDHGFVETEDGFIIGEYANYSARIFIKSGETTQEVDTYQIRKMVRHIHLIYRDGDRVYITTGDSDKFFDLWRLKDGELQFEKRLMRRLGGFTTCCRIKGKTFFGSDFSERPNYIWCLETNRKYFFPRPAYTRYCYLMLPLNDRYIVCFNRGLARLSGGVSVSIFDTETLQFVQAQEYTGDVFVTDYVEKD